MQTVTTVAQMRTARRALSGTLGFVPTMGALHAGHLSLVRTARQECDLTAVSIFVNPAQFGPQEDLERYPRPFEQDYNLLLDAGVDLLFAPTVAEMYPGGACTFVNVEELSGRLDGLSRPGHFRGVATIVAKLFHIVQPRNAYFGQKDAAQVAVLQKMVRDLNFDVNICVCPIVREADGLAMSSRNVYLSPEERKSALVLSHALNEAAAAARAGEHDSSALLAVAHRVLGARESALPEVRLDYLEIVQPETLLPVSNIAGGAMMAIAAWVGKTRLIDNVLLPRNQAGK